MNRGIYTAYSVMAVSRAAQEMKAGNLANMATPGYKGDSLVFSSFNDNLLAAMANFLPGGSSSLGSGVPMTAAAGVFVNLNQGPLEQTGNRWDLALVGEGFFTLEAPEGETVYTRNGRFSLDAQGYVVNDKGWYLLGQTGRIHGIDMDVDPDGNIVNSAGDTVDVLALVSFPEPGQLRRLSADHYGVDNPEPAGDVQIKAGYIEAANTELVTDLTDMMMLVRTFEMGQSLIHAQDKMLDLAANQIGSLRG